MGGRPLFRQFKMAMLTYPRRSFDFFGAERAGGERAGRRVEIAAWPGDSPNEGSDPPQGRPAEEHIERDDAASGFVAAQSGDEAR